jgi:hypothetical protein
MCDNWNKAYGMYCWTVDLTQFKGAVNYPGYFNRVITPNDVTAFENEFRRAIDEGGSFEIAGEVCFWKIYGVPQSRDRRTQTLLDYLSSPANWNSFVRSIQEVSNNPSYDNFIALQNACNQPRGFAIPVTFLSFYKPTDYPMVDKHIAHWWAKNRAKYGYEATPIFSQRYDGWIQTYTTSQKKQNWRAYIAWKTFCNDYAARIAKNCGLHWRARDVEMAVWEAQKNDIPLEVLP